MKINFSFLLIASFCFQNITAQNTLDSIITYNYDEISNQYSFSNGYYFHFNEFGILREETRLHDNYSISESIKFIYDEDNNLKFRFVESQSSEIPLLDHKDTTEYKYEYNSNKRIENVSILINSLMSKKDYEPHKMKIAEFRKTNDLARAKGWFVLQSISIPVKQDKFNRIVELEFFSCDDKWKTDYYLTYLDDKRVKEEKAISTFIDSGKTKKYQISKYYYSYKDFKPIHTNNEIDIYPNPFQTLINLKSTSIENEILDVEVYSISGKKINSFSFDKKNKQQILKTIHLYNLPKGIYFLKINTTKGSIIKKVVSIQSVDNKA